jgi:pimeloyl-ACP methyl ester carboxylesterase
MGADTTPLAKVTLSAAVASITSVVNALPDAPILVGHSLAGLVLSEVAEQIPDRVAGLVYVAAALLPNGVSFQEGLEQGAERSGLILSEDGLSVSYDPDYAMETFYNTTDPDVARRALSRLTPQPLAPIQVPLKLTRQRFGRVRRAYIECTEDRTIAISLQRQMREVLPCEPVFTLSTDHSPFLSAPDAFTNCLEAIGNSFVPS